MSTNTIQTRHQRTLRFDSYADLSTRLVLMPRVEEEGVGAIVASFVHGSDRPFTDPSPKTGLDGCAGEARPGSPTTTLQDPAESTTEQPHDSHDARNGSPSDDDCIGLSIVRLQSKADRSFVDEDFSSILAVIREAGDRPIVLHLDKVSDSDNDDDSHDDVRESNSELAKTDADPAVDTRSTPACTETSDQKAAPKQSAYSSWSAWGSRMRAQSERLAEQANKAAQMAKERAQQQLSTVTLDLPGSDNGKPGTSPTSAEQPKPKVFLQSSLGAYFPIDPSTNRNSLKVTTSSLLVARISATEPCPKHYRYQWYRSSCGKTTVSLPLSALDDASSVRSGSVASAASSKGATVATQPSATGHERWIPLVGAVHASFQPNASLVGYRLQCVVTIPDISDISSSGSSVPSSDASADADADSPSPSSVPVRPSMPSPKQRSDHVGDESDLDDDSSAGSNHSDDDEVDNDTETRVVCGDLPKVSADTALFNAARQALARGARFGALKGCGNAAGRTFGLEIKMAAHPTRRGRSRLTSNGSGIVASVLVSQVVADQVEPLSSKPLLQASAFADPVNAKRLDLVLPLFRADGTSAIADVDMLQALSTNGVFQLEAPNRMMRESILLALGIANFGGKPSQLSASTILFPEMGTSATTVGHGSISPSSPIAAVKSLLDDEASCLTASSGGSSAVLHRSVAVPSPLPKSIHASSSSSTSSAASRSSLLPPSTPPRSSLGNPSDSSCASPLLDTTSVASQDRVKQLEAELVFLRSKLTRKDKVVSELQRQLTTKDAGWEQTKSELKCCQADLQKSQTTVAALADENKQLRYDIETNRANMEHQQTQLNNVVSELKEVVQQQQTELDAARKTQKSLQNDKAVLQAAVEAREAKLAKMQTLQNSFRALEQKVGQHERLKKELEISHSHREQIKADLERVLQLETDMRGQLHMAQKTVDQLNERLQTSEKRATSSEQELKLLKDRFQTMKMERNNFKAKNDSLSREIAKLCRDGRTLKDVERIVADEAARIEEVEVLRRQKRKALEEAHEQRTLYERSKVVSQQLQSTDADTLKAVERSVELERLLTEMTEYVNAKEMQMETLKQVNHALQEEIHTLAKANMRRNDI